MSAAPGREDWLIRVGVYVWKECAEERKRLALFGGRGRGDERPAQALIVGNGDGVERTRTARLLLYAMHVV